MSICIVCTHTVRWNGVFNNADGRDWIWINFILFYLQIQIMVAYFKWELFDISHTPTTTIKIKLAKFMHLIHIYHPSKCFPAVTFFFFARILVLFSTATFISRQRVHSNDYVRLCSLNKFNILFSFIFLNVDEFDRRMDFVDCAECTQHLI